MEGRRLLVVAAACLVAAACASGGSTPEPSAATPSQSAAAQFHGTVRPIDAAVRARMTDSWRPGCPVPLHDLRLLTVDHWGFDGSVHRGEIAVHEDQAAAVIAVFRELFAARFPIERMELVDVYGADDERSMEANNTSGFNCREATGQTGVWSEHSFGRAIDINPVQNPYVTGDTVLPPAGRNYIDRSLDEPGMIHEGDVVVRAFASIGWEWGGDYHSVKDYQHFSATGR